MTGIMKHPHHDSFREWAPGVWQPSPPMPFINSPREQKIREKSCINSGGHYLHTLEENPHMKPIKYFCCWCGHRVNIKKPTFWERLKKGFKK